MDVVKTESKTLDQAGASIPRPTQPELWPLWSALNSVLEDSKRDLQSLGRYILDKSRTSGRRARLMNGATQPPVVESTERLSAIGEIISTLKQRAPWTLTWPATDRLYGHFRAEGMQISSIAAELQKHATGGTPSVEQSLPSVAFFRALAPLSLNAFLALTEMESE